MIDTITYQDLERALERLGFAKHIVNGYVAFREPTHDALIALPAMSPDETVLPRHLAMVRTTLTGRGVADEEELETALAQSEPPVVS